MSDFTKGETMKKCTCNICKRGGCCQDYAGRLRTENERLTQRVQEEIEGCERLVKSHENFCKACCESVKGRVPLPIHQKAKNLDRLMAAIESFEAQRTGNPQPVLLEFAWNEVISIYEELGGKAAPPPEEDTAGRKSTKHSDGFI